MRSIGGALLLFGCAVSSACAEAPPATPPGANAVYVESKYLRGYSLRRGEKLVSGDVEALGKTLTRNGFRNAFLFAGPYLGRGGRKVGPNERKGQLPRYPFSDGAKVVLEILRREFPGLRIAPWVGGVQNKTVSLEDPSWRSAAVASTVRLLAEHGLESLHLNIELMAPSFPFFERDGFPATTEAEMAWFGERLVEFHGEMRERLPDVFLSTVVPATAPQVSQWKIRLRDAEMERLVGYVDQVVFMMHDTSITDQAEYETAMEAQILDIVRLRASHPGRRVEYLLGVGSFTNDSVLAAYRDESIENLQNSLETIEAVDERLDPTRSLIDGVGLYCEWETSPAEWAEVRRFSLARGR